MRPVINLCDHDFANLLDFTAPGIYNAVKIRGDVMNLYLFGRHDPEIGSLIHDAAFQRVAASLFQQNEVPIPDGASNLLERAEQTELLHLNGQSFSIGRRLTICPASAEDQLADLWSALLSRYVEITRGVLDSLRQAYTNTKAARDFDWTEVEHALIAGCFLDLAMGRVVARRGLIQYEPGDTVVWAFEHISANNSFGVQKSRGEECFFAQLWHRTVRRDTLHLPRRVVHTMLASCSNAEYTSPKESLYLRYLGLLRQGNFKLPVFLEQDTARLLPVLLPGAQALVSETISPALDLLQEHGWWQKRHSDPSYRHAAIRLFLEYGTEAVVENGLIHKFPTGEPPTVGWGRWLWQESPEQLGLVSP